MAAGILPLTENNYITTDSTYPVHKLVGCLSHFRYTKLEVASLPSFANYFRFATSVSNFYFRFWLVQNTRICS